MAKAKKTTKPEDNLAVEPQWKPITNYLNSGVSLLNLAITGDPTKGFPSGRITHVYGAEASAKTVIALEPLSDVVRKGGVAYYDDAEGTFDPDFAKLFGIDANDKTHFVYRIPNSIEDFFDRCVKQTLNEVSDDNDKPVCIALDTMTVLPSAKNELGKNAVTKKERTLMDGGNRGARAKPIGDGLRKYSYELNDADITLIMIDQARTNPNGMGDTDVTPGGRAPLFYSTVRVKMSSGGKIYNENKMPIGAKIRFSVVKNKIGPPFRSGEFRILFDFGIDNTASNVDWLVKHKGIVAKGSWFEWNGIKAQGIEALSMKIEDEEKEFELEDSVAELWHELHSSPKRKEKRRR